MNQMTEMTSNGPLARCSTCGKPDHDLTMVWARGHWWCVECAKVTWHTWGPEVEFPSGGKMVPGSIFMQPEAGDG